MFVLSWCHQLPNSRNLLDNRVYAALDQSSLPAFLPHSGRLTHQVLSASAHGLERALLDQR